MVPYLVSESVTHRIYRVGRLLRARAVTLLGDLGMELSPEQWAMLLRIHEAGPGGRVPVGSLVDPVLRDHPNVTRVVDGLELAGLVRRMRNPEDRRSQLVAMTGEGVAYVGRYLPEVLEAKGALYEDFDERDVAELQRLLAMVEKHLI